MVISDKDVFMVKIGRGMGNRPVRSEAVHLDLWEVLVCVMGLAEEGEAETSL